MTAVPAERYAAPETDVTFAELGVPLPLVEVLAADGIAAPFPVQAATLPDALAGRDILGRARTGSGKTLGFSLPLVTRLAGGQTASKRPRGLVLVPTRELATQVQTVLRPLARAMGLWVTTIYGGVSYSPQVTALQRRTDIVVATPGRLADLIGQGQCDLSDVEITVIDEADQMADLGFLPIVRRLLETTPDTGQRLLFSATLDAAIDVLARRFLTDPVLHSVDENSSPAEIEHHVLTIDAANRVETIAALAGGEKRSLVFTRTKHGAERLARQLTEAGIPAAELHGNLRQGARSRNLAAFASGIARVMVATDIAARGIHIDGIDLVIHADPPAEHKAYVHRSGRTARGGADGVVVTLQTKAQSRDVNQLMRKAGITPFATVTATPGSDVLSEIAGPPAPRVTVAGKVSELVSPEDRLTAPGESGGRRSRPGGTRDGRPRRDRDRDRDRKSRDERPGNGARDFGPRDSAAPERAERARYEQRPARDGRFGQDRPAWDDRYGQRSGRDGQRSERDAQRFARDDQRFARDGQRADWGQRPNGNPRSGWDQRGGRDQRPGQDSRGSGDRRGQGPGATWGRDEAPGARSWAPGGDRRDRPANDWRPRGTGRSAADDGRPRRGNWRPGEPGNRASAGASGWGGRPETGGRPGGGTARSGYSPGRTAGGKGRDYRRSSHF